MTGGNRPSGGTLTRNTPRSVRMVVLAARSLVADEVDGIRGRMRKVEGGMPALQVACGHDSPSATRTAVAQAEAWSLMRRSGATSAVSVYVVVDDLRLNSGEAATLCRYCSIPSAAGCCKTCQPAFRRDRAWRTTATNLLHEGKSLPEIAAIVNQPLYPGPGDSPMTGVVAHLLAECPALVPHAFREGYSTTLGASVKSAAAVLTARSRQRRHRRQPDGEDEGPTTSS